MAFSLGTSAIHPLRPVVRDVQDLGNCSAPLCQLHGDMQKVTIYAVKIIARLPSIRKRKRKDSSKRSTSDSDILDEHGNVAENRSGIKESMLNSSSAMFQLGRYGVERVKNLSRLRVEAEREGVLKACLATCGGLFAAGLLIRQASHWAAETGWPFPDSTLLLSYGFETWHLGVMLGLVVTVSTLRQLLLYMWPSFAKSSETANQEILGSLLIGDYFLVACFSGISEEFFFRGALLPLFGVDWKGATLAGLLFGVLHLNGGRRSAFVVWASFVGILYGLACVSTCSILVPMAAHSLNNYIGATIWKFYHVDKRLDCEMDRE